MEQMSISSLRQHFESSWQDFISTHYVYEGLLAEACLYALQGAGKRTRPILYMLFAQSFGKDLTQSQLMVPAFALEMIHTYSLVHDDLPIFDDDDMRRGRPTVHVKYDQATALLVGDALLSDAWALLSGEFCQESLDRDGIAQRMQMIRALSLAVGSHGMVQGQMLDHMWTNKPGYSQMDLQALHQKKTGDLIAAACKMGSLAAGANSELVTVAELFGSKIGLAFQVIDDLLDGKAGTGKSQGKDKEQGKLTFLQTMSYDRASAYAKELTDEALSLLTKWPVACDALMTFVQSLLGRTY